MRTLVVSVAIAAAATSGCSLFSQPAGAAPRLSQSVDRRGTAFTLDNWQYDEGRAFLCLQDPGQAFTGSGIPPVAATCVPLLVHLANDQLNARFDVATLSPEQQAAFAASVRPWYFAVTGSRGSASEALVLSIDASPIPSDPGPS